MVKVSVLYPSGDGVTFDHDYYENTHIPWVIELVGDALKGVQVERGIAGGAPGAPAPYICTAHLVFDSMAGFESGMGPHLPAFADDGKNYTNVAPVLQIGEVAR